MTLISSSPETSFPDTMPVSDLCRTVRAREGVGIWVEVCLAWRVCIVKVYKKLTETQLPLSPNPNFQGSARTGLEFLHCIQPQAMSSPWQLYLYESILELSRKGLYLMIWARMEMSSEQWQFLEWLSLEEQSSCHWDSSALAFFKGFYLL